MHTIRGGQQSGIPIGPTMTGMSSMGRFSFPMAQGRAEALGEIHARPFALVGQSRVIFQLAFLTEGGSVVDHAVLAGLARARGVAAPGRDAAHFAMGWGQGTLRWERHTEFSTYFWDAPAPARFGDALDTHPFGDQFSPPGSLIAGVRLEVRPESAETQAALESFDPTSLCLSEVKDGQALIATDFRQDGDGLTRILVIDKGMTDAGRGAVVQRLLDIETYRTLAALGLSLARSLSPEMRRIEDGLTKITQGMKTGARENADSLLADITVLAAELEANAALSLYRFGASRAYYNIVRERISSLNESGQPGFETIGAFLEKRLAPAMRTCQSIEERQANLSRKLSRATALLRSWIALQGGLVCWSRSWIRTAAASFFGASAIMASVVISRPATEAASCRAVRTTLAGSMMPILQSCRHTLRSGR
jgi:uncharacterized membrane-anchored protein